jgi:HK97 family phage major capsid protein
VQFVKAAVAGGGTGSGEWAAELARLDGLYTGDFITFLYGRTIFDRLPLREVPARVRVKGQDGAATGYWVGESKAIPSSAQDYSTIDLTPLKVAALCVLSNELIEDSAPAADMLARDSLVEASSQKVDSTFLGAAAASAGVSPAGILNGVTAIQASGTDEAAVRTDMQALAYPFVTAKMASGLVFAMNPAQGLALGSFVNTFSMPSFPGINETGGTFLGRTVYTGDNVTPGQILLIRSEDIWRIGDSGVQVSMSDVATIEMNDAPAGASDTPVDMASHRVSMFQTESTAFKVVRRINFQKRRSNAVTYIDNAEYGGVTS